MTRHTETPWRVGRLEINRSTDALIYFPGDERVLASVSPDRLAGSDEKARAVRNANVSFIVHAVNLYDEAREALRALVEHVPPTPKDYAARGSEAFTPFERRLIEAQNRARALLAKMDEGRE